MGMKDLFNRFISIPPEDDYDDEQYENDESFFDENESEDISSKSSPKKAEAPKNDKKQSGSKVVNFGGSQVQVVLVKPTRFEDAPSIADHLNARKTVVLNLEAANRDTCRRLIDFLSGTAYATRANIKKVANSTYIITPVNVDVLGELVSDDVDTDSMFLGQ